LCAFVNGVYPTGGALAELTANGSTTKEFLSG
jgi:hypothetical protein